MTIAGGGDRRTYQQDVAGAREAIEEIRLDVAEGADMVMVKPALPYLDVISAARRTFDVPLAAYHVSGEYAMVCAAAERGWLDLDAVAFEHVLAIRRAGADVVLTYFRPPSGRGHPVSAPARGGDTRDTNEALFERAQRVIPGGVNSPVRAFRSVGGTPYFVAEASGPFVYDVEGRRYIDYVQSYGPGICGHAHPTVVEAVQQAAARGTSYGAPTRNEVLMAEEMCARVEGLEMVRLTNSGTEAVMSAVRLARGVTGRPTVVKFAGCYHGHSDALLVAGGSGVAQQGLAGSEGVTAGAVADTIVAPYNVVPELDETVAVVCVEPVAANMGLVAPERGFLQGLRNACDEVGALLLFDEVITGFRLCPGGAAEWFGVQPDIWCFGKVIGGGLPIGRLRGLDRDHVRAGAPGRRVPGRHPVGQSTGHRRGPGHPEPARRRRLPAAGGHRHGAAAGLGEGVLGGGSCRGGAPGWPPAGPVLRRGSPRRLRRGPQGCR